MVSVLVLSIVPGHSVAADKEGRFAVKGAGISNCERFLEEREKGGAVFYAYGGWLEGYLTAANQYLPQTYDMMPWETTNLLAGLLAQHCKDNPKKPFIRAVRAMLKAVRDDRLTDSSVLVMAQADGKGVRVYREVLRRIQARLKALGLYSDDIDGTYNPRTRRAIAAFQKEQGLEVTRLPDQNTLLKLLR
jgi:hypothetical protein